MDSSKQMTSGNPAKLILFFAIPLMIGNIFQQLYTMVDTMIVGQVLGVSALAALGAADWLIWLVQGIITGMTQGFSIQLSQDYGAQRWERLKKSAGRSILLTIVMAISVFVFFQVTLKPILLLLNTPVDILDMAMEYARVIFLGLFSVSAYNLGASFLRAMGDSNSPLRAMLVASVINIVLDIVFVAYFHWGIAGAAFATILSQTISALYCFLVLREMEVMALKKQDFDSVDAPDQRLLRLGFPMAAQNVIIAIGGLCVQYVINGFGSLYVAGFTATNKMYGLLELAALAFGFAMTTYVGQNLGAGKILRIKEGVKSGSLMALLTSGVITVLMFVFGRQILSLFISGDPNETAQVLKIAYDYLRVMASCLWVLYLLFVFRSTLQGLGDTFIPMISGFVELVCRVVLIFVMPRFFGMESIYFVEVFAWSGATFLLVGSCLK
ncbi:MAG: MATE family efflux transporter, partial [Erysipelotrichaceae bacterium]|nr:MATE family efflux transporter [Erysipelotrichaceae bacterium]